MQGTHICHLLLIIFDISNIYRIILYIKDIIMGGWGICQKLGMGGLKMVKKKRMQSFMYSPKGGELFFKYVLLFLVLHSNCLINSLLFPASPCSPPERA